jgi:catechol 2,3-dioxygenase-like lactoylglutathione lyase family enzyme
MGVFMRLVFLYVPVTDLAAAAVFYRDVLGLDEAWREGDDTIAFHLPDSPVRLMVSTSGKPPGPMYLVPSVQEHLAAHPDLPVSVTVEAIPDGVVVGIGDPAGNTFYLFDQAES